MRESRGNAASAAEFEAFLARIPHLTDDLMLAVGPDGRILWTNAAMEARLARLEGLGRADCLAEIVERIAAVDLSHVSDVTDVEATEQTPDGTILLHDAAGRQEWYRVQRLGGVGDPAALYALQNVTAIKHREQNLIEANSLIEHRLNHDPQTGLPNRRLLTEEIGRALARRAGGEVGVVVVEIQQFAEITSLHGPDSASEVVQEACFTLLEALPEEQFLARSGPHEFTVVFEGCAGPGCIAARAQALYEALQITVPLPTGNCTLAVRVAHSVSGADSEPEHLLMDPLVAMHHPDTPPSVFVRAYDPAMRAQMEARSALYADLKDAVARDEIEPFFQPQIRLDTGGVIGFEVLARWRHPARGLVSPGVFLGIAEDTGLLPGIDAVIMRKAVETLAGWRERGFRGLRVSLNASGHALRDPSFTDRLKFELDRHGCGVGSVSVEILESVLIEDAEDVAAKTIADLRRNGFHLELDDFGTGYASIATLITLKVDTVKLDRALVKDLCTDRDSYAIVESTLALTAQLGVQSLAEGVETAEQIALLRRFGCDFGQGFGIGRPMPEAEATAWLVARGVAADPIRASA